ncbi:hypothetical protein JOD27_007723 [Lentzea nigeriaca]|nr:hypothetical protein [Lentzea nigeriaca]
MAEAELVAHEPVHAFGSRRVLNGVSLTAAPWNALGFLS